MPFTSPGTYVSLGTTGYLATFSVGTVASPPVYTVLLDVRSITPSYASTPEVDISTLQSPGNTREYIPGMIKPGEVDITANFLASADQTALYALEKAQTVFPWKIVASMQQGADTYTATGTGFVKEYHPGPWENDKPVDLMFKLQITGPVTETLV